MKFSPFDCSRYPSSSANMRHYLKVLFGFRQSFHPVASYALARGPNMAATLWAFHAENYLWHSDGLENCWGDLLPRTLCDGKSFSGLRRSSSFPSFQRWCSQATLCGWSTRVALVSISMLSMRWSWWMHTMTLSRWLLPRCGEKPGKSEKWKAHPVLPSFFSFFYLPEATS